MPDWEAWLMFFLRSLVKQKEALAKKIAIEDQHATDLHPLAKKILTHFADQEALTLSQLVKLTNGKPSTLKLRLKELVQQGHLLPKGQGRGGALCESIVAAVFMINIQTTSIYDRQTEP